MKKIELVVLVVGIAAGLAAARIFSPAAFAWDLPNPNNGVKEAVFAGEQARVIFQNLKGNDVEERVCRTHRYLTGKYVTCSQANGDWNLDGRKVPEDDPNRFECTIAVDMHGNIVPAEKIEKKFCRGL